MLIVDSAPSTWVQLLPTAVAGATGLVGVIYGALWASRTEDRKWVRQELLETFVTFTDRSAKLLRVSQSQILPLVNAGQKDQAIAAFTNDYIPAYVELSTIGTRFDLLAPNDVTAGYRQAMNAAREMDITLRSLVWEGSSAEREKAYREAQRELTSKVVSLSASSSQLFR
jgi:hypothetical protein